MVAVAPITVPIKIADINVASIEDITRQACTPTLLAPGIWAGVDRDGKVHHLDLREELEESQPRPDRKTGTADAHDAPAFIAYLSKHALPETEVWADIANQKLVAVINTSRGTTPATPDPAAADIEGAAGWGDHRVQLVLRKTPAWTAWVSHDKQFLSQTAFAEHIEERLPDFAAPAGAEMLELAQSFRANTKVDFESSRRLSSGETTLVYREQTEATAGKKGDIVIPDTFTLGVAPFDGTEGFKVTARFRYRITDAHLTLGYVLERPEDILRAAFDDIVTAVDGAIAGNIWHGTP
jgi:uncharacterized protein YfdQ (DUF2303 family)